GNHFSHPRNSTNRVQDAVGDDPFHGAARRGEGEGHFVRAFVALEVVDQAARHDVEANFRIDDGSQRRIDGLGRTQLGLVHAGFLLAMRTMTATCNHAPTANTLAAKRASSSAPSKTATARPARPEIKSAASTKAARSGKISAIVATRC